MRSFIALFALAAIATVADAAAKTEDTAVEADTSVAKDAAAAAPEDRGAGDCPTGFMPLPECDAALTKTCVKIGPPLKYVSWLHMQYQCDVAGGYLPEPSRPSRAFGSRKAPLDLILKSYEQLFGATTLYLGGTDITVDGTWKWLSAGTAIASENGNWADGETLKDPADGSNTDCLTLDSETLKWKNVNCEENSAEIQIADICFAKAATS